MKRRYKLLTTIVCFFISISMVAFGVYAASSASFNVGMNVSFDPINVEMQLLGYIDGSATGEGLGPFGYYASNKAGITAENGNFSTSGQRDAFNAWEYAVEFDPSYEFVQDKPNDIVFYLQYTNYSEFDISYNVTISETATMFDATLEYYISSTPTNATGYFANLDANSQAWSKINYPTSVDFEAINENIPQATQNATSGQNFPALSGLSNGTASATTMIMVKVSTNNNFDDKDMLSLENLAISVQIQRI